MRSLLVFRHGKSDWSADGGDDLARPLSPRGRRNAATMGRFLASVGQVPDLVLVSPAVRAAESLRPAAGAGRWRCPVETLPSLYSGVSEIVADLVALSQQVDTAMVVGHEPTSSELTELLVGGGRLRLATAAMARVDLDITDWSGLAAGRGTLAWLVQPRLLERL